MARRQFNVFNLSFLDVMSCGLGAVILFFMVINAQVSSRAGKANVALQAEASRLEEEILDGRKNLVRLRTTVEEERIQKRSTDSEAARIEETLAILRDRLARQENTTLAKVESVEDLQADIERLEAAKRRLAEEASEISPRPGRKVRSYVGDGNRQYLTGMQMGGKRVLILVDASASMLGRTYVNVVRFRNLPAAQRLRAPKWQQTVNTVDWLTTQIDPGTRFQIYAFNEDSGSVLPDTTGTWLDVTDGSELTRAVDALRQRVPEKGTSLYQAFRSARGLDPPPDNIYLLTDGLPTQGPIAPASVENVRPDKRVDYFQRALRELPARVPVNVLLYPMDGDPGAAGLLWSLALSTRGSFLTPARDWP